MWQGKYLNKVTCGDCLELLKELPDESVDMCMTSPPYWGLRSYQHEPHVWDGSEVCEHLWTEKTKNLKHKAGETNPGKESWYKDGGTFEDKGNCFCIKCNAWKGSLGLEPTFELYIQHLCVIFDEVKRVLKKTGSCWVNISDSYSGSNCGSNDYTTTNRCKPESYKQIYKGQKAGKTSLPNKSLVGIPERFALAMTDKLGWIRRNTIIWYKPNCMPASVQDRFTVDFEYLYFFTKSPKYHFEQQFEPLKDVSIARLDRGVSEQNKWVNGADGQTPHNLSKPRLNIKHRKMEGTKYGGDGKGLHDHSGYYSADGTPRFHPQGRNKRCVWEITTKGFPEAHFATFPEALVETPIKAGCPEGGVVLDLFMGSGTSALMALKLNRNFIGFEISPKYVEMANKRIKPLLAQGKIELK